MELAGSAVLEDSGGVAALVRALLFVPGMPSIVHALERADRALPRQNPQDLDAAALVVTVFCVLCAAVILAACAHRLAKLRAIRRALARYGLDD